MTNKKKVTANFSLVLLVASILVAAVAPSFLSQAHSNNPITRVQGPAKGSYGALTSITVTLAQMTSALTVNGNKLYLSNGTSIVLRGVDYTYFMDNPNGSWMLPDGSIEWQTWDTTAIQNNLNCWKAWGCNEIQVFTTVEWWVDNTDNFQSHIKTFISMAQAEGMYVLFTFYRYNSSESDITNPLSDSGNGFVNSQSDFVNLWLNVSNALSVYPNVIFQFWVEPSSDEAAFFNATQSCITAIRNAGAANLIDVQWGGGSGYCFDYPTVWGSMSWVTQYHLNDPARNIMYGTELWRNMMYNYNSGGSTETNIYDTTNITYVLNVTGIFSVASQHPVEIDQIGDRLWGMPDNTTYEDAWFNNTLSLLDQYGIGYAGWAAPPWRSGVGEQYGYVIAGSANYTLDTSGTILVNHLTEATYTAHGGWSEPSPYPSPLSPTPSITVISVCGDWPLVEVVVVIIIVFVTVVFITIRKRASLVNRQPPKK
jgi:hypothetical protein